MKRVAGLFVCVTALAACPDVIAATSQAAAVGRLTEASAAPVAVYRHPSTMSPYFVRGRVPTSAFSSSSDHTRQGADFWRAYGGLFGVDNTSTELYLRTERTDIFGVTHLRYEQRYRGLRVFGRQLLLHLRDGDVIAANGHFADGIDLSTTPTVSDTGAAFAAGTGIAARGTRSVLGSPTLLVQVDGLDRARLAWLVTVSSSDPLGIWRVFVDARTGEVLRAYNDLHTAKNRITHSNGNDPDCNVLGAPQCTLPGTLVRDEDDPPVADAIVQETHANTGLVYDYYSSTFGRDSYDSAGHVLRSTVHFGAGYDNAFWCGDLCVPDYGSANGGQMVYGDGSWNGTTGLFSPLGEDLDVVAHELTHGVTEQENGLDYFGQAGALNESYSDVFAAMIDIDGGEWLIGEDSWTPGTPGDALRNMANPAAEGQPAHMNDYVNTVFDSGGVHTNSGIPNHAAYLAATDPGYGIGRANLQRIYYAAMPCLSVDADFLENLQCLVLGAQTIFPGDDPKARAIRFAHAAVGIAARPTVTSPNGGETLAPGAAAAVTWTGGAATGAGFVLSVFRSAPENYIEGFQAGTDLPAGFTTGAPPWTVVGATTGNTSNAARSGAIGNNGRTELHLLLHMASSASMTFARRVSTEQNFDLLSFHVDGIPVGFSSGISSWGFPGYMPITLSAGAHELVWVYEKDSSDFAGEDAVWIDSLFLPSVERAAPSLIAAGTGPDATSQTWAVPSAAGSYRVRVQRLGIVPWLAFDDSDSAFTVQAAPPPPPPGPPPPAPPAPPPPPHPSLPTVQVRCVVPNVKGKTVPAARIALSRARCALGRVSRAYSRRVRKSRIISQSRRAASRHPRGTRVNVVVSRGRRR
jgi:bacillolysin